MGNLHLVTGHAGQGHVTAADHGSLNASIFGNGQYVLNRGSKFAATVISNNAIRIADGDILLQGRHVRLNENSYVDLTIENGSQDMLRNDLIVARYSKDSTSGIEDCNLIVIKGTPASADPVDPEYIKGDLMVNHDSIADMPLYRVPLNGLAVQELVPLFESFDSGFYEHTLDKTNPHNITAEQIGARPNTWLPTFVEVGGINKNLLHNWYFPHPVNDKGATEYSGIGNWSINCWRIWGDGVSIKIEEDGIALSSTNEYNGLYFVLSENIQLGREYTISCLFDDGLVTTTGKALNNPGEIVFHGDGYMVVLYFKDCLPHFSVRVNNGITKKIIAVKVEFGSAQTLAHKDSDGNWVLNEIPNYAEQAAICAQYSTDTGEYMGSAKPFAFVQNYTASTTLVAGNMGNFLSVSSDADLTVTIPLDDNLTAPVGVELEICRYSTGNVTVVGESGVSVISSSGSTAIGNQYGCVTLKKLAANTWLISGDLG